MNRQVSQVGQVAAVLASTLLAGCGAPGGDPAAGIATQTVAPPPAPSPSPTLPAAAKKATRTSAVAFTRHWFAVYNHATWARTSDELTPISDPACVFCNRARQAVENFTTKDQRVEGGRITVGDARVTGGTPARGMRVDVVYDQAASTIRDSTGAVVSTGPVAKGAKALVAVKWTGSKWVVLDVALLS